MVERSSALKGKKGINRRVIGYTRVSTIMQQESGAGLKAQEYAIRQFCAKNNLVLLEIFTETHTGGDDDRPILKACIETCQEQNASLVVAKLDRLSRRLTFIISFKETYEINFYVANLGMDVNKYMLQFSGIFAEMERDMISARVREGIAQKKRAGTFKGAPGNKEIWKSKKGNKAHSEKTQKYRAQIYRELDIIYKRYKNAQLLSIESFTSSQQEINQPNNPRFRGGLERNNPSLEGHPKMDNEEEMYFVPPELEHYVEQLNERGNVTSRGYAWTKENLRKMLKEHQEELKPYQFEVRYLYYTSR